MDKQEVATIAYFDQFDFPLTKEELERWKFGFSDLDKMDINSDLEVNLDQGFYFLKGREEIIDIRKQRYIIADKKFTRALKFARLFRMLPSVCMIAICNTLAFSNARETSDIDFFIVTKPGSIWLTRFWLQFFLRLFRLRPHDHGISIQDALCLSFFTTTENLDFTDLQIQKPDIYLALWLSQLVTVYDPDNIYQKIWDQNSWIKDVLPAARPYRVATQRRLQPSVYSKLFSFLTSGFFEKFLKKIQNKLLPESLCNLANIDTRVILNDSMLKFHSNDRRLQIYNKWQENFKK